VEAARDILTVGHSTHPIGRFVELLRSAEVEAVADVRRYPGSRRNPQFGAEALAASLAEAGIGYEPFGEELGGRRRARRPPADSPWRNAAFAAYAEYMESEEFGAGLERLEGLAASRRVAVMCAESMWWRCHRRLIADALTARDWNVLHLLPDGRLQPHPDTLDVG
jgi:uncharacterized protein (DUF488 family)